MKRYSAYLREENFEHVLMCLICRCLFDEHEHQPKFLPCHHTFCKDCLREYVHQMGDEIECPSCRKPATIPAAGVAALQTNFCVKYIQALVRGGITGVPSPERANCLRHKEHKVVEQYCHNCESTVCRVCLESSCANHTCVPVATVTGENHQKLDIGFERCNGLLEHKKAEVEALSKALSLEKDEALKHIESTFEQHAHTLNRRATLLKNKVIDIYNEHAQRYDADLEEISTALTCIVSLKEYHEDLISKGHFEDVDQGLSEMNDVYDNIIDRILPQENHIVFEDKHAVDKFKSVCKDLGRVRSSKPLVERAEPIGGSPFNPGESPARATMSSSSIEESPGPVQYSASGACAKSPQDTDQELAWRQQSNGTIKSDKIVDFFHNGPPVMSLSKYGSLKSSFPTVNEDSIGLKLDTSQPDSQGAATAVHQAHSTDSSQLVVRPKTLDSTNKRKVKMTLQANANKSVKNKPRVAHNFPKNIYPNHVNSAVSRAINYAAPINHDVELLRETDKMYHHLVYTSYDEEELLKELGGGGQILFTDPSKLVHRMNESDSWQTTSSVDEMMGSIGEDQQTTL